MHACIIHVTYVCIMHVRMYHVCRMTILVGFHELHTVAACPGLRQPSAAAINETIDTVLNKINNTESDLPVLQQSSLPSPSLTFSGNNTTAIP